MSNSGTLVLNFRKSITHRFDLGLQQKFTIHISRNSCLSCIEVQELSEIEVLEELPRMSVCCKILSRVIKLTDWEAQHISKGENKAALFYVEQTVYTVLF